LEAIPEPGYFQPILVDFVVMVEDAFGKVSGTIAPLYGFASARWAIVEEIA